ncbi:MAG: hypothetical protein U0176_13920 [Bacteroidia bacterium]
MRAIAPFPLGLLSKYKSQALYSSIISLKAYNSHLSGSGLRFVNMDLSAFSTEYAVIMGINFNRFVQSTEKIHSEYVLVGTMANNAVAILSGVLVNWLSKIG